MLEVAVVAMPDEHWGERPKAFVTLKPGDGGDRGGDDRVLPGAAGALQVPRGRRRSASCPRPSTGKIQKFVLREREWVGHDKRIH